MVPGHRLDLPAIPRWCLRPESNGHLALFRRTLRPHQLLRHLISQNFGGPSEISTRAYRVQTGRARADTIGPKWGEVGESNSGVMIHNHAPKPLGQSRHTTWSTHSESNAVIPGTGRTHRRQCFECNLEHRDRLKLSTHPYQGCALSVTPTMQNASRTLTRKTDTFATVHLPLPFLSECAARCGWWRVVDA